MLAFAFAIAMLVREARADLAVPTQSGKGGTFCEFEVFSVDTHKAMSGFRYTVTLPNGVVKKGVVPKSGRVHYDVKRAGTCTIELDLPRGMRVVDGP